MARCTHIIFALWRNGVDELDFSHVVLARLFILFCMLQKVVPGLRRQLRLKLCAQDLLFQRLGDGRHDCESTALQFCGSVGFGGLSQGGLGDVRGG